MLTSFHLHMKNSEVCTKTKSPPASLPIQGQVTKHTTVKWPIGLQKKIKDGGSFGTAHLILALPANKTSSTDEI